MAILEDIKKLRARTGAGVVDAKKALDETNGNMEKAIEFLRKQGTAKAMKKSDREALEGIIGSYVHSNGKLAALVKVSCETDFVARNVDFKNFAKDIAMHIVAANPGYLKPEDVPQEIVEKERMIWKEQLATEGKPKNIIDDILAGKEKKFREEMALLTQPFVKDPDRTIQQLLMENIAKIGENIQIDQFVRFEL